MPKVIKVIATPTGEAPEWVREAWVGLEFPVADQPCHPVEVVGVLNGKPDLENLGGYPVWFNQALTILAWKDEKAARWWEDKSSRPQRLVFGKQFCEVVIPVIPAELIKEIEERCPACRTKLEVKGVLNHRGCGSTSYYFCATCKKYFRDHQGGVIHNPFGFKELFPNPENEEEFKKQVEFDVRVLGVES